MPQPPTDLLTFSPNSTNIRTVSYNPATRTLSLQFHSSPRIYTHLNVPQVIFDTMKQRRSAGSYYLNSVKSRYKLQPEVKK